MMLTHRYSAYEWLLCVAALADNSVSSAYMHGPRAVTGYYETSSVLLTQARSTITNHHSPQYMYKY